MVIKIFSDKRFLPPNFCCHMLIPFWGEEKTLGCPDNERFDKYAAEGKKFFQMVSLEEADVVVYPAPPIYNPKAFKEFQIITSPKPLIVFFNDDSDQILDYRENTYVFRTSFYKTAQRPTEFAIPGWSSDYGSFIWRPWEKKPTVSFCGQIYPLDIRKAALDTLEKDTRVCTRFIRRDHFWGGWIYSGRKSDVARNVRFEFLQNMMEGSYNLCARGGGNFSYRLYETMMSGRIPLFVNTDCVLPYDFLIDWKKFFPIVDQTNIQNIGDTLMEFHNSLSPDQFIERQKELRQLWEEWISPIGFFKNIHKHLRGFSQK